MQILEYQDVMPRPRFDSKNPLIISLDQNVVSLMETWSNVNPAWSKIKSLLVDGVRDRKIVCPIPHETAWESVLFSDDRYARIKKLQTDLSLGLSFKSYAGVLGQEVLALVRPHIDLNPCESGNWHDLSDYVRRVAPRHKYEKLKYDVAQKMNGFVIDYENRALPYTELARLIDKKESFDLYNSLTQMQSGKVITPTCLYTKDVCAFLQKSGITNQEIEVLKQLALHHKYTTIPIHKYHNRIVAQFEYDLLHGGRRQKPNDVDDFTRAATALWAAQVYICDAEMAELLRRSKMAEIQAVPLIVFSTRHPELFLSQLESL
jgi:hypothetical protein